MESLFEAALAFAKECLNRPDSVIKDDTVDTGPEFNLGPPGYLDATGFEIYDLQRIMQMVTAWCQTHAIDLALLFSDQQYTCQLTVMAPDSGKVHEIIEFNDHEVQYEAFAPCVDACYVLLGACVHARRTVKRIVRYYESAE